MTVGLSEESSGIVPVEMANSDRVCVAVGIANSGDAPPRLSQVGISQAEATQATRPINKTPIASGRRRLRCCSGSVVGFDEIVFGFPTTVFEVGSAGDSAGLSIMVDGEVKPCEALLKASANDPAVA